MTKSNLIYAAAGILLGAVIGFFGANALNKSEIGSAKATPMNSTSLENQVRNEVVRDQSNLSAPMPEISLILDKAQKEPQNIEAQTAAADLYLRIRNFEKAIEFLENANKIDPENYKIIVKLGNSYFDSKKFDQAEIWYRKALEKKPDDYAVRTDLGTSYVERESPDFERAIAEFENSLKINPKHPQTLYNLAAAYFKSGNLEKANETAGKLKAADPQNPLNARLAEVLK
ncbi:MAG: tetratricopeptide repeat protein [Pyrinomonadaceae bacterium]|nr:tetratricopeptide repeat protein [Pyrinomonadaceae bacterium]